MAGQAITPTPAGTVTGIAFSPVDNTYFVVTDSPAEIVQADAGLNIAGQTAAPANPNLAVAPFRPGPDGVLGPRGGP